MIRLLTIQGFRSIDNLQELQLGRVNVFVGANGSGKSNLLEALGVLGAAAGGRVDDTELLRRGVRPGVPRLFKTAIRKLDRRPAIHVTATWEEEEGKVRATYSARINKDQQSAERSWRFHHERLARGNQTIAGRSPRSQPLDPHVGEAAKKHGHPEAAGAPDHLLDALVDYGIYTPTTAVLRGLDADREQREPVGLSGGQLASALVELLPILRREPDLRDELFTLLDWVEAFGLTNPSADLISAEVPVLRDLLCLVDYRMKRGDNTLTAYDASEGVLYVLFLAVLALHPASPRLFAIDNFDTAMHPQLCRAAIRFFVAQVKSQHRQVLLTTHNPLALDGLDLRDPEVRLFAVERDKDGATACQPVKLDPSILDPRNPDRALSQLWVMGYLGGVPGIW